MPLQDRQLLRHSLSDSKRIMNLALHRPDREHTRDGRPTGQTHAVMLNALQLLERKVRTQPSRLRAGERAASMYSLTGSTKVS